MALDTSKIIHAPVGGGRYTVTAPIVKEDYGLYLLIEGLELPSTYEVDFSNSEHNGTSVTMIGNSDGVLIPSQFISSGKDVFAFLYHVGVDFGRTVYKFRIPNKLRPDRTNEEPTPEEQSVIDQAISALNTAVAQTAQDVIDADASERMALGYAESAQESARQAQEYSTVAISNANSASQSASQASASATASAQSASQSAQIKADVEDMVDDAQASASASAQSATASANSASQASGYAQSASASAQSASGYASSAQTSAQTASSKASEASTSASTASAKATESAQSASQALTYKTDAESAKTASQTAQGLAESARDSAISAKDDAESARDEAQTLVDSISGKTEQIDSNTDRIESLEDDRYKPYATDSASGAIASFTDGADDIPLKSLSVNIDPVQNLHGYDSPWVAGGGKNLLDTSTEGSGNYTITSTGEYTQDPTRLSSDYIPCVSGETYVVSGIVGANTKSNVFSFAGIAFYDANKAFLERVAVNNVNTLTATAPQDAAFMRFFEEASKAASELGGTLTTAYYSTYKRQIEVGSTATDYAPYENICPISGWEGMEIKHTGKNLLDPTSYGKANKSNYNLNAGATLGVSGGNTTVEGENPILITNTTNWRGIIYIFTPMVGVTYRLSYRVTGAKNANIKRATYIINSNGTVVSRLWQSSAVDSSETYVYRYSFTVTESGQRFAFAIESSTAQTIRLMDLQIEVVTSAESSYEPYNGATIPISWQTEAGTVYGGKLDVLSGVLTVENKKFISDGSDNWGVYSSFSGYYVGLPDMRKGARQDGISNMLTNSKSSAQGQKNAFWLGINNNNVYLIGVYDSMGATLNEFKAYLAEHNLEIIYPLATPITIQLDPREVNSLLGVNNIWADTGDTALEYRADPDLYIRRKMPEVPVDDVQIDGSSIVVDGVANVPIASSSALGAIKVNGMGLGIYGNGDAYVSKSNFSQIKNGVQEYSPIVPSNQHQSVFFGLAKAASDTTQSASSNAVGTYTEEAKIAIQKMLGIYEAPWELIEDFTLEEEGGFDKTAEPGGTPYNFRSVYIRITVPANSVTATSGYGRWLFADENNQVLYAESGKYTTNSAQMAKSVLIERRGAMAIANNTVYASTGGRGAWSYKLLIGISMNYGNIQHIYTYSGDKEPAGARIEIYAQRAY